MKEKQVCQQITIANQKVLKEQKSIQDQLTGKLHTFHFVYFTWNNEIKWIDIKAINEQQAINQWLLFKENANMRRFMYMKKMN